MMIRKRLTACLAACALVLWCAPAMAQSGIEYLTAASKSLEGGDAAAAASKIDEALGSGKLDQTGSAKAFLLRGQAHEKQSKAAQALADYTNAIFLQSLSAADRPKAVEGRKRTLAALGLSEDAGGAGGTQTASSAGESQAQPAQSGSGGGIGGFFTGLFNSGSGGSSGQKSQQDAAPQGWAAGTRVTEAPAAQGPAPIQSTAAPGDGGQYNILLATVSSEEAAQGEARRLNSRLSDLLEGKTPEVLRVERGETAVFRIVAGPFEGKARSREICDGMKGKGVSCIVSAR